MSKLDPHPLTTLPREDLEMVTELVLQSGSLKDLATSYGVSYPTIRARVDKLIERLRGAIAGRPVEPLTEFLADLVEDGALSPQQAKTIRDLAKGQPHSGQTESAPAASPPEGERPAAGIP